MHYDATVRDDTDGSIVQVTRFCCQCCVIVETFWLLPRIHDVPQLHTSGSWVHACVTAHEQQRRCLRVHPTCESKAIRQDKLMWGFACSSTTERTV